MADQNFEVAAKTDLSPLERLADTMKNIDSAVNMLATAFSGLNQRSNDLKSVVDSATSKLAELENKLSSYASTSGEISKNNDDARKSIENVTKAIEQQSSAAGGKGPPIVPPKVAGGFEEPGDEISKRAAALARLQEELKRTLSKPTIGITEDFRDNLDPDLIEKLRSRINALATSIGLSKAGVKDLGEAFRILETDSGEIVIGKVSKIINQLQAVRKIVTEDAERAAEEQRRSLAGGRITDVLKGVGVTTIGGVDDKQAEIIRVGIDRLSQGFISGKITAEDFRAAIERINTGGFDPLSVGAARAEASLRKIIEATQIKPAPITLSVAGDVIKDKLDSLGIYQDTLRNLSGKELEVARTSIDRLTQAMVKESITADDLNAAINRIISGSIDPLSAGAARAETALRKLIGVSQLGPIAAPPITLPIAGDLIKDKLSAFGIDQTALNNLKGEQLDVARANIDRLAQAMSSGKISADDLNAAIKRIISGGFEPLGVGAAKAEASLKKIIEATQTKAAVVAPTISTDVINNQLKETLDILGATQSKLDGLKAPAAATVRVAINNLAQAMQSGKISSEDLRKALENLQKGGFEPLTGGAATASAQLSSIGTAIEQGTQRWSISWQGFIRLIEVFAIKRILSGVLSEFKSAFKESFDFETTLTKITITMGATGDSSALLTNQIRQLAVEFGRPITSIASASYEILAGRLGNAADQARLLNEALRLSTATLSEPKDAARILAETMGAFGIEARDASAASSALFATTTLGRTELKNLEGLLGHTAIGARSLGISMNEVLAAFISLRDRGVPAQQAISTLNGLFSRLVQGSRDLNAIFLEFGYLSTQQAVQALGLGGALQVIVQAQRSGTERTRELAAAFVSLNPNIRDVTVNLGRLTTEQLRINKALGDASGQLSERWNKLIEQLKGHFNTLIDLYKRLVLQILGRGPTVPNLIPQAQQQAEAANALARQTLQEQQTDIQRSYQQLFANVNQQAIGWLIDQRNRWQNHSQLVREDFTSVGALVRRVIQDANREIRESQRSLERFAQTVEERSFERRVSILPPTQQVEEFQNRVNQLRERAILQYQSGMVREGGQTLEQVSNIIDRVSQLNVTAARQYQQDMRSLDSASRSHLANIDRILSGENRLRDVAAERARHEAAPRSAEENARHQATLANLQTAAAQSRVTQEETRYANQILNILERRAQVTDNVALRNLLLEEVEQRRVVLLRRQLELQHQQRLVGLVDTAGDLPGTLQRQQDAVINNLRSVQGRQTELNNLAGRERENIATVAGSLGNLLEQLRTVPASLLTPERRAQIEGLIVAFSRAPSLEGFNRVRDQLQQEADLLAQRRGSTGLTQETVERSIGVASQVRSQLELWGPPTQLVLQRIQSINTEIQNINERLRSTIPEARTGIAEQFASANLNAGTLTQSINGFNTALDGSVARLNRLIEQAGRLREVIAVPAPTVGSVNPFQSGGLIGGKSGIDQNIIRVSRGEFIMNADSTNKFLPQLQAMNAGYIPRFQSGGMVTTNVGDVTVNNYVSGGSQESLIRDIGNKLVREIRRGTLRLN